MFRLMLQSFAVFLMFSAATMPAVFEPVQTTFPVPVDLTDVPFPTIGPESVAVSLLATVDVDGHVSDIHPVDIAGSTVGGNRYTGPLVGYEEDSIEALKHWKFAPKIDTYRQTPSLASASVTFLYMRELGLEDLPTLNGGTSIKADYVPPILVRVRPLPQYPANNFGVVTVVLQLDVREDGSVAEVKIMKSVPHFDEPSTTAVKNWLFAPATLMGKPVRSAATVAIVDMYRINDGNN